MFTCYMEIHFLDQLNGLDNACGSKSLFDVPSDIWVWYLVVLRIFAGSLHTFFGVVILLCNCSIIACASIF